MAIERMRPKPGQSEIILPVTFDYSGGRRDKTNSAKVWSVVLAVLGFFISIANLINKNRFIIVNIFISLVILFLFSFIIRFFVLNEGSYRREFILMHDRKMKFSYRNIWGIYSISKNYPYICRFRNGKSGIFIRLNKDVILGKYSDAEYEHYEAIADAYNIAGSSKIQMCHVDYMSNIGMDERLDDSFATLGRIENEDIKDLLTDIYSYQKEQMLERLTTYDIYLFQWRGSDISAWSTIQKILSCFMQANFRSYQVLHKQELRSLTEILFNLEEFSVVNAMSDVFNEELSDRVVPIKVDKANGETIILGKTQKQRQEELKIEEKKIELQKQEKRKGALKKDSAEELSDFNWDEELDINE